MIPKFRVWQKSKKRWVEELGGDVYLTCDGQVLFGDLEYDFAKNVTDDIEIMQSTGLYDKNGVEIYEGDICRLTNTYLGMNTKSTIEIAFDGWGFVGRWPEVESPTGYMVNPLRDYNFPVVLIEVIGNIYENPELGVEE